MPNLILDIQTAAETRLKTLDEFQAVPILIEERGDPVNQMQQLLDRQGVAVYIATPTLTAQTKDVPGPYFISIALLVQVYEVVALNRMNEGLNKTAAELALCIANALHQHHPSGLGMFSIATGRPAIASTLDGPILIYDVHFDTHGGLEQS
jgi:hypothetical protein